MCNCEPRWRRPAQRFDETPTQYTACTNCGEYSDHLGRRVVAPSQRCPNFTYHHLGALCLSCGQDERLTVLARTLTTAELAAERTRAGLDPDAPYLIWWKRRVELIMRIRQGRTIAESEYQHPQTLEAIQ